MLSRTSSHMFSRWYLPMFLFRDGLLTLMYNASFINLLRFWSSLPTVLKFSIVTLWLVVLKVIYRGGCLQVFFEPLSKCSWGLSNVFFITFHPVTFVSIYDSTFLLDGIVIFWSHQKVLDGIASFKVDLHSMFTACFLYAFTNSFIIWSHHMWFLDVVTRVLGASAVLVSCGFSLDFNPVQHPCRIFASCECLFYMFFLLLQQLRAVTDEFELCDEVYLLHYT